MTDQRARVCGVEQLLGEDAGQQRLGLTHASNTHHQKHEARLPSTLEELVTPTALDHVAHRVSQLDNAQVANPQPVLLSLLLARRNQRLSVHFVLRGGVRKLLDKRDSKNPLENADAHVLHGPVVHAGILVAVVLGDGEEELEQSLEEGVGAEVAAVEHALRRVVAVDGLLLVVGGGEDVVVHENVGRSV